MMKGPGIFLAQFMADTAPFNRFDTACRWAAGLDCEIGFVSCLREAFGF